LLLTISPCPFTETVMLLSFSLTLETSDAYDLSSIIDNLRYTSCGW